MNRVSAALGLVAAPMVCLLLASCSFQPGGGADSGQEVAEAYVRALNEGDVDAIQDLGEPGAPRARAELALEEDGGSEFVVRESYAKQFFVGTCTARFDGERDDEQKTLYVGVYVEEGRWYQESRWYVVLPSDEVDPDEWTEEEMLDELGYDSVDDIPDLPMDEWIAEDDGTPCPG